MKIIKAEKNERANALNEAKRFCKEFSFTTEMLKGSLARGRKANKKQLIPYRLTFT